MTAYNKASLKTYFEQLDVPSGTDYANLIDSQLNLVETAQQNMAGPIYTTKLISPLVSAATVTGTVGRFTTASATTFVGDAARITTVSATTVVADTMRAATVSGATVVSDSVRATTVSAGTLYAGGLRGGASVIVSAAGTAQATAAAVSAYITRGQGVTDDSATGFKLPLPTVGWSQIFIYEGAVSANLWPNSGCVINALSADAAFGLTANTTYLIIHKSTSAYAVK